MAIREGRWDCSSCGSTAIYGRHVDCPGCGRPRPAGVRFYLSDDAPVVTDPERLREARAGADWVCARCGASNRASVHACAGCGAPREVEGVQQVAESTAHNTPPPAQGGPSADASAPESSAVASVPSAAGSAPASPIGSTSESHVASAPGSPPDVPAPASSPELLSAGPAGPPSAVPASGAPGGNAPVPRYWVAVRFGSEEAWMRARPRVRWGLAGAVGLAALMALVVLTGQMYSRRTPAPRPAVVDSVVWERWIVVEEHRVFAEEGWNLPDSAMDVVRSERVRDYRKELAGYETVTREVPRTRRVLTGYEEETRTVSEREQTGTRTYTCGTRDLGNGYFEDVECSEPVYETVSRTERVSVPVYENETEYVEVTEKQPVYRQVPIMAPYYTYRVPRWTPVDTLRRAGTWETRPAWPAAPDSTANRRPGWRHESNRAVVRVENGVIDVQLDEDALLRLRPGLRVAYAGAGGRRVYSAVLSPDSLRACRRWHAGRGKPPPDFLGCSPRPANRR